MKKSMISGITMSVALAFLACGGGGGGTSSGGSGTPPSTQDPAGIWIGTNSTNGVGTTTVIAACDPQGNFRYFASDDSVGLGSLTVSGATFTGSGIVFPSPASPLALALNGGTLSAANSLTSQWSAGGTSGSLNLTFNTLYARPVTLASLAGDYQGSATSGTTPSLTILPDGTFQRTGSGEPFSGTITLIDTNKNLFRVTMTQAGEDYTGLAFWSDGTVAAPLSSGALYVHVSNRFYGMAATFTKQ